MIFSPLSTETQTTNLKNLKNKARTKRHQREKKHTCHVVKFEFTGWQLIQNSQHDNLNLKKN